MSLLGVIIVIRSDCMDNFDFIVLNIYLLAIFSILIKAKTALYIYRFFKLLNVGLFIYLIVLFIIDKHFDIEGILKMIPVIFLIGIVVQTEVGLLLRKLGVGKNFIDVNTIEDNIKIELIKALDYLSGNKIGAIITFEKNIPLKEHITSAYEIMAPLNSELLSTIFYPNTPLHDGAVIIRRDEIVYAGAYYPTTEKLDIPKQLGSRHRAAIGISEVTDSLTIVVSEQSGNISVAIDGYLDTNVNKEVLIQYLETHLQK
jgi:diadenylate cyclase